MLNSALLLQHMELPGDNNFLEGKVDTQEEKEMLKAIVQYIDILQMYIFFLPSD